MGLDTVIDKKPVNIKVQVTGWVQVDLIKNPNDGEFLPQIDIRCKITQFDVTDAPGIPKRFIGWMHDGLLQLSGPFHIKNYATKPCIQDKLCIEDVDLVFKKNSIVLKVKTGDKPKKQVLEALPEKLQKNQSQLENLLER